VSEVIEKVESAERAAGLAGKYLTFKLADEEYGLGILRVKEIIGLLPITSLPQIPSYVRGVINLREKVIPVIDLRKKFKLDTIDDTGQTCIIVVDVPDRESGSVLAGILVDAVSEVLDIRGEEIEEPPAFGAGAGAAFISGMAKTKGAVKILLDIDMVLSSAELERITKMV
jgi:purine-binding chemotaxis protein CheW